MHRTLYDITTREYGGCRNTLFYSILYSPQPEIKVDAVYSNGGEREIDLLHGAKFEGFVSVLLKSLWMISHSV